MEFQKSKITITDGSLLFISFDLRGYVEVGERRTREDYAEYVVEKYHGVDTIRVVQDNMLKPAVSMSGLMQRRQENRSLNFTTLLASWLKMAEIEFSEQCLDRRIGDMNVLEREVKAWEEDRNRRNVKIYPTLFAG